MIYSGRAVKIDQAQGHLTRVSSLFVSSAFLLNPLKSFFPAIHLFNSALLSDLVPSVSSRRDSLIILPAWSLTRFTRAAHGLLVASVCLCVNPLPSHSPPTPHPLQKPPGSRLSLALANWTPVTSERARVFESSRWRLCDLQWGLAWQVKRITAGHVSGREGGKEAGTGEQLR